MSAAVPAARAQENCSLQTMVGTYAFQERGSSAIVDLTSAPHLGYWNAAISPFATVGEITFTPDGTGKGYYWIRHGPINGGLDPIPVTITITEMNEDCTGKFTYQVNLPGITPPPVIEERIILFDNGRQFRTIPTSISSSGDPNSAWIGFGRRIGKAGRPVHSCGPETAKGKYLLNGENLVMPPQQSIVAVSDTVLLSINVSMSGDYTGMLYEKLGNRSITMPIFGAFTVNSDCSFSGTVRFERLAGTAYVRGVFFDEGKGFYALTLPKPGEATRTMYSVT
jgi:hypothetical protein